MKTKLTLLLTKEFIGLNSPPKPHAFVSLPVQSEFSFILISHTAVLSSLSKVVFHMSNAVTFVSSVIPNPILLCVSISLVLIVILCAEAESSNTLKGDCFTTHPSA